MIIDQVDAVVIGAGVVGLACASALARLGREVIILESTNAVGTQTSSRNSEVIHAGIYYPRDSLKARYCVRGRELLYAFSEATGVAARRCGKLIVACTDAQAAALQDIREHALGNGVSDIRWLDAGAARELEPALSCVAALHSPSTGIVDSHGLMLALQGQAEQHGAMLALLSRVQAARRTASGIELDVIDESEPGAGTVGYSLMASLVINAAGHDAVPLGHRLDPETLSGVERVFTKGNYFRLQGRAPFSRLIYPVPEAGGLGVHLTLDLGGQARFGPDVQQVDRFDYPVDPSRSERFYNAIRQYWPDLPDNALLPDYAGFRPKLQLNGKPYGDFLVRSSGTANARMVHLLGIESPGLTSALAIGEAVSQMVVAEAAG